MEIEISIGLDKKSSPGCHGSMDLKCLLGSYENCLKEYVKFASISADPYYKPEVKKAHAYISDLLRTIGFGLRSVETSLHPIVWAHRQGKKGAPHILFYGHYDVQPVDPLDEWKTDPFEVIFSGERFYGRGTSDDKGPHLAIIFAAAKILEKYPHFQPSLTFVLEGEEEMGSPNFEGFLKQYKDELKPDIVALSDTISLDCQRAVITTGLRGLVTFEVHAHGASIDLHSGIFGGAVANPLQAMCSLFHSLRGTSGKVNIPGFYEDVVGPHSSEIKEIQRAGDLDAQYKEASGVEVLSPPQGLSAAEAIRFWPTLELNGIGGGYQGEGSKTIIPSSAWAKFSCRLVPNQEPEKIIALIQKAIQQYCPPGIQIKLKVGSRTHPYYISPSMREKSPYFRAAEEAVESIFGQKPFYLRGGGSIGVVNSIKEILGCDSILLGLSTPEDRHHAPNESLPLAMAEKGIGVYYRFLENLAKEK